MAVAFFNFINQIYESTSIVINTNKKPTYWSKQLDVRSSPRRFWTVCSITVR
jgi:hypothetical protein